MKSALSLTLAVSLVASALPVTAQEQEQTERPGSFDLRGPAPTARPLARAMSREAVRLAAEGLTPSAADTVQHRDGPADAWLRVRALEPGTEITLTVTGSPPGKRSVVRTDESGLTVLNVTDPAIPAAVAGMLIVTTQDHPDYFGEAQQGGTFRLNRRVRLAPDGVFLDDRRVVELGPAR